MPRHRCGTPCAAAVPCSGDQGLPWHPRLGAASSPPLMPRTSPHHPASVHPPAVGGQVLPRAFWERDADGARGAIEYSSPRAEPAPSPRPPCALPAPSQALCWRLPHIAGLALSAFGTFRIWQVLVHVDDVRPVGGGGVRGHGRCDRHRDPAEHDGPRGGAHPPAHTTPSTFGLVAARRHPRRCCRAGPLLALAVPARAGGVLRAAVRARAAGATPLGRHQAPACSHRLRTPPACSQESHVDGAMIVVNLTVDINQGALTLGEVMHAEPHPAPYLPSPLPSHHPSHLPSHLPLHLPSHVSSR